MNLNRDTKTLKADIVKAGGKEHSDYGGSVADKWMNCPGYTAAVVDIPPQVESIHMAGGTAQHALNEAVMNGSIIDISTMIDRPWLNVSAEFKHHLYIDENLDCARVWVDEIFQRFDPTDGWNLMIESTVVMSSIHPTDIYGSADLIAINPAQKHFAVVDYKHGAGKIVDIDTPQIPFYGVSAADTFRIPADWTFTGGVIQPRVNDGIKFKQFPEHSMQEWRGIFRHAHTRSKEVDAPRLAGEHCNWCRAAPTCKALADQRRMSIRKEFSGGVLPGNLTPEERGRILDILPMVESWISDFQEGSLQLAIKGDAPNGYILSPGRRGARAWSADETAIVAVVGEEMAYTRKIVSPAQAEKAMGKDAFDEKLSAMVTQPEGKPCLKIDNGENQAFDRIAQARADFTI